VKTKPKKVIEDLVEEFDCEQGSAEWFALKLGIPSASNFHAIMAGSEERKQRTKLLYRMAAEIIYQRPMETFSNAAMAHGLEIEPEAASHYAFTRGVEVCTVGFIKRTVRDPLFGDFVVGCSPDRLVGDDGILQIKRAQPDLIVQLVDSGREPTQHRWQCQGEMWVSGRKWLDLKIYYSERDGDKYREFPISPTFPIERSESAIADLRKGVEEFSRELQQLVARMRKREKSA
jgi:hypothetical protein